MKKISTLLICMLIVLGASAQKRNMIANSRFEENYKHWRAEGSVLAATGGDISYDIDSVSQIAGNKSAKITISRNASNFWDRSLCYYLPVTKDAQYQIRFKAMATGTTVPLVYELGQNHSPWGTALAKGDDASRAITVTETTQEFVINATADVVGSADPIVGDPNWVFKFNLGNQPNGAIFWIDDISVTQINGNWDGNLVPKGDFEEAELGYNLWFDLNGSGNCATFSFDTNNQITGRSLHILKTATSTDWKNTDIEFNYWQNEMADYELSFDVKAVGGSSFGQLPVRSFTDPQDARGTIACLLSKHFNVANADQVYHFTLNKNSTDSSTYQQLAYTNNWKGFTKFVCGLGDDLTPLNFEAYLDNIKVQEIITLNGIEIDGPTEVTTDTTYRIWANPTNADNSVTFSVTNGTGEAVIDADGNLTAIKNGTVTITATSNVDDTKKAQKEITISGLTSVKHLTPEMVKVYPNPASDYIKLEGLKSNVKVDITDLRGVNVAALKNFAPNQTIDLSNIKAGTYFVKITSNNKVVVKKVVKK